ncbi:MAG: SAM-dependent methyltransferase [Saprospiraceae bacterium]|nr:SAM-dependent methyltransferase [Saprospiraceae bacterium]
MTKLDARYWQSRYQEGHTPWDIGYPAPALLQYVEQLEDKSISILIPGAGFGHEAAWLYDHGFSHTWICEWAPSAVESFKMRHPNFPSEQILCQDFFSLTGLYNLILEQTFFSAIDPLNREDYARKCRQLLQMDGRLAGLLFAHPFETPGPPFGATRVQYEQLFSAFFSQVSLRDCIDSIKPREGRELFLEARP